MGRKVLEEIVAKMNSEDALARAALLVIGAVALCVIVQIVGSEIVRFLGSVR